MHIYTAANIPSLPSLTHPTHLNILFLTHQTHLNNPLTHQTNPPTHIYTTLPIHISLPLPFSLLDLHYLVYTKEDVYSTVSRSSAIMKGQNSSQGGIRIDLVFIMPSQGQKYEMYHFLVLHHFSRILP